MYSWKHRREYRVQLETATGPRPLGVITVVVLGIICGIAMVAMGGSLARDFETTALGSLLSMIGLVSLGVSYGLWKGKKWAWNAGVALSGIAIIVLIASLFIQISLFPSLSSSSPSPSSSNQTPYFNVIFILFFLVVLGCLSKQNVKRYFK
jgi:cytochrome bd-type quinol oxidase subunit 2